MCEGGVDTRIPHHVLSRVVKGDQARIENAGLGSYFPKIHFSVSASSSLNAVIVAHVQQSYSSTTFCVLPLSSPCSSQRANGDTQQSINKFFLSLSLMRASINLWNMFFMREKKKDWEIGKKREKSSLSFWEYFFFGNCLFSQLFTKA